jgi:hypothetical protein
MPDGFPEVERKPPNAIPKEWQSQHPKAEMHSVGVEGKPQGFVARALTMRTAVKKREAPAQASTINLIRARESIGRIPVALEYHDGL